MFLGIDPADVNCGFSVINHQNTLIYHDTSVTPEAYRHSIMTKNLYQSRELVRLLNIHKPTAVGMESPAFGASFQMVSIGYLHGAFLTILLSRKIPFVWVPPTKVKYAFLSSGKAKKPESVAFCRDKFNAPSKGFDHNAADATIIAYFAKVLDFTFPAKDKFPVDNIITEKFKEVFFSDKLSGGRKTGVIHRPFEFFWHPSLTVERQHV